MINGRFAMKRVRTGAAIILAAALTAMGTGCIGSFAASNKLAGWNASVSTSRFVNEVIFLALTPVYTVTLVADLLVINAIEFWSGENPFFAQNDKPIELAAGNSRWVQIFGHEEGRRTMRIDQYSDGAWVRTLTLAQDQDAGNLIRTVVDRTGARRADRISLNTPLDSTPSSP
jgi:hypothetical protein